MTLARKSTSPGTRAWARRVVRALSRTSAGATETGTVVRVMGHLVPHDTRPAARSVLARPRPDRGDLVAEWTRSGDLTYGEAEALMALDETTSWSA
jgi:hypothetical protein